MKERERILKIATSCFLGAVIGLTIAREVNVYFWWLGMLAGGLTGYLSYEWGGVLKWAPEAKDDFVKVIWSENKYKVGSYLFAIAFLTLNSMLFLNQVQAGKVITSTDIIMLCVVGLPGLVLYAVVGYIGEKTIRDIISRRQKIARGITLIPSLISKSILLISKFSLWNIKAIGRFFRLIHSDVRLLVGFDSALGVGIGYLAHLPVLTTGLVGACLGVVSYLLITRPLLVPKKN